MSTTGRAHIDAFRPKVETNARDIGDAHTRHKSSRHIRQHYEYGATRGAASANRLPAVPTKRYVSWLSGSQPQKYQFLFQMKNIISL